MNMFKSRRRAKDQSDALGALTSAQSPPASHKTIKSLKRKNKNNLGDTKPVLDLSTALPDDNDFRTSLLMPNLSARFSMLREQDDPNTKMGKASDDSVLFPKRVSRMNLFNHNPLPDLAEVESEYSTFRPPFAERDRSNSLGDGYDSDNGGIMNRPRAGDGNNLFGGRLKFYKIPNQLARNVPDTNAIANGKNTSEHDVSSPHRLYRRQEKDTYLSVEDYRVSVPTTEGEDSSDVASPATAFSKKRGTQSSTNSAPRRSSTAATSVASESPVFRNSNSTEDGVAFRTNEGLAPTAETNSTLSVSKTREDVIPNRFLSNAKRGGYQRPVPIYASTSLRNASSPIVPMSQPLDFGFKTESRSASATGRYQTDSPTPSPIPENDSVLAGSVQPNDRGKATALGLFNKPAREFDEDQFNQRQLQMHEGQVSSMSNNSRSVSRASDEAQSVRQNSVSAVAKPTPALVERESTPYTPPVPSTPTSSAPNSNRVSKASTTPSVRPRSKSSASVTAVPNVKARIESLIRKQNAELAALEAEKLGSPDFKDSEDPSENKENYAGAFFDNESDTEESNVMDSSRANSSHIDESHIHPAFRNSYRVSDGQSRKSNYSSISRTRSMVDDSNDSSRLQIPKIETEIALTPAVPGLSGLIRTHLRQDSDKSSILPRPDSVLTPSISQRSQTISMVSSQTAADNLKVDAFDVDVDHGDDHSQSSRPPLTPTTAMSQVAQQFLSRAMAMKDAAEKDQSDEPDDSAEQDESSQRQKSWREDLEPKHQRGESSETTKERREFDEELAARRRKIKEGLKSVTERERSQSPATASRGSSITMQAFVQQRAVTDPQPKAMKMLGIHTREGYPATPDDARGRNMSSRGEHRGRTPDHGFNNQTATFARFDPNIPSERPQLPRSATPPAIRQGRRDRSHSNVGNRSKSRTGQSEQNPPVPNERDYFTNWSQSPVDSTEDLHERLDSHVSRRNGYQTARATPPDVSGRPPVRHAAKPSPISPTGPYDSPAEAGKASPVPTGRTTPSGGRATPTSAFSRKRSVTKTMISEPKFLSSTSSVPLVHLPEAQQHASSIVPPLPMMNPRRRGNTMGESPFMSPTHSEFLRSTPLEPVPASPVVSDFGTDGNGRTTNSPSPRKLRKANSEGGSMAAKARQQAMASELSQERMRSPAMPMFPNRSATTLDTSGDGGMF